MNRIHRRRALLLLLLLLLVFSLFSTWRVLTLPGPHSTDHVVRLFERALPIDARSLTAILPVSSPHNLSATLAPLLDSPTKLARVILVCPQPILSDVRKTLAQLVYTGSHQHPQFSLYPASHLHSHSLISLAASRVKSDWILFLNDDGLAGVGKRTRDMLLNPLAIPLPLGPTGAISRRSTSCTPPASVPYPASHLSPPFVAPLSVFHLAANLSTLGYNHPWLDLANLVSRSRSDHLAAVLLNLDHLTSNPCPALSIRHSLPTTLHPNFNLSAKYASLAADWQHPQTSPHGTFALAFPTVSDLYAFLPVACRLFNTGYSLNLLLYRPNHLHFENANGTHVWSDDCRLSYDVLSINSPSFAHWLASLQHLPDIIVALTEQDSVSSGISTTLQHESYNHITLVRLPREDIPHSYWMGSLSLLEWQNWNVPEIAISVITTNRPRSLHRLLLSLSHSLYFGDTVLLRINIDQSPDPDPDTLRVVRDLHWAHGDVVVHHRVVHGGLLPAVVEAWYPHHDHSYGVLLEDDVEVSRLFYAWAKMAVLRYRYGDPSNLSPQLFGISLYQQKSIELRPEGRRPFDARALFAANGFEHPATPYLSQIPCSWGAVYFPEQWREFHEYLAVRFSRTGPSPSSGINAGIPTQDIVPAVRSNKWKKSWKKYFIELVYLRGYVMLYPNYDGYASLSTNHLEVGAHVREMGRGEYLRRKEMFGLPLMALGGAALVDLPARTLPPWRRLPVLNLTGCLSTVDELIGQGAARRADLFDCQGPALPYDVPSLFCVH
ncbi:hypothetical protein SERLADRAFT_440103 [Serpula lacrymans var. lacrymans S7.9]|uniref:Glycosyltransferase family 2 protein n=1 Tax=Serpula lacrymans var. lacrymans (strain S7.9) TaxID=578457 RepID=F8P3I2_SERL9|nr:uncharacterized protein SERLADRAFT_440103 [Serpula lacrymans var. lacrymans S7.9]EGO22081.1 hypothetical protein SERLADRAFT_440103 [Serpula lacrymans var. lacrymans S7.9]